MGLFSKTCSVCSASRELTEAVDKLLDQKPRPRLRDIATTVGCFSKSSIHRHSRHYAKSNLPRIYRGERFHVIWPGDSVPPNARPEDWIVQVTYEEPLVPESAPNPSPLLSAEIIPEPANGKRRPAQTRCLKLLETVPA
jgi:hypothetical protein